MESSFHNTAYAKFKESLEHFLEDVKDFPLRYPYYKGQGGKQLHKAVIMRLTVLLLTFDDETVTIEATYDARSNWQRA